MTAYLKLVNKLKKAREGGNIELAKKLNNDLNKIDKSVAVRHTPFGNYQNKYQTL